MNSMADMPTTSSSSSQTDVKHEQLKTRRNSGNGDKVDQGTPLSLVSLSLDVDSASIHQCLQRPSPAAPFSTHLKVIKSFF
jgi:hypothetical protein